MSNQQKDNRKAWMQAQRKHLAAAGQRCGEAVSTGWESARRGLRALARAGGGFLAASWDGRYRPANTHRQLDANLPTKVPSLQAFRPATTPVAAVAEGRLPQQIAANPIAFMKPSRFSVAAIAAPMQRTPVFDLPAREQAGTTAAPALSPSEATPAFVDVKCATERQATDRQMDRELAAQLEELFAKKCDAFSSRLERRIDSFCEQTSTRLEALSQEAIRHFSEALNEQATEALKSLMTDWAEQNRVLVDAECRTALDRFASRLEKISSSQLEGHRKEIQNLSANLKARLRGVAHALQDLGPVSYRS